VASDCLRSVLDAHPPADKYATSPLVFQFSSLSSPGTKPEWLAELCRSFCGPTPRPSSVDFVFPTQSQVGASLEGWIAGSSIPCDVQNAEKLKALLGQLPTQPWLPRGQLCVWDGGDTAHGGASGRSLAVPHIKSVCRYSPDDRSLPWALVGSCNLSQAAWGKLEKKGTQLFIKSYELGVLVTSAAGAPLCAPKLGGKPPPAGAVLVPLPFSLPPTPYRAGDVVWSTTDGGRLPHTQVAVQADRHGRLPGDEGHFYENRATGRQLAEATARRDARLTSQVG